MKNNPFKFIMKICPKCGKETNSITNKGICPECHDDEDYKMNLIKVKEEILNYQIDKEVIEVEFEYYILEVDLKYLKGKEINKESLAQVILAQYL